MRGETCGKGRRARESKQQYDVDRITGPVPQKLDCGRGTIHKLLKSCLGQMSHTVVLTRRMPVENMVAGLTVCFCFSISDSSWAARSLCWANKMVAGTWERSWGHKQIVSNVKSALCKLMCLTVSFKASKSICHLVLILWVLLNYSSEFVYNFLIFSLVHWCGSCNFSLC